MKAKKTSLKYIQDAWVHCLLDFRAWFYPESQLMNEWKMRPFSQAVRSCRGTMIDDAEGMLTDFRKSNNQPKDQTIKVGNSGYIPIMLTATALIDQPPSVSSILSVPYENEVIIGDQICNIRMINASVRAQIAFFATNPDDARSVCQQFCAYMMDDERRKFMINFELLDGVYESFGAMILENELYPSPVPLEQKNLSIFTVDATIICSIPQVVIGRNNIDHGYDKQNGIPNYANLEEEVIVRADAYLTTDSHKTYVEHHLTQADDATGETSITFNVKD